MLVLTRRKGEKIIIGDSIEIIVVDTRGDRIKLGIKAPCDIPVHRLEVYEVIKKKEKQVEEHIPISNEINQRLQEIAEEEQEELLEGYSQ